MCKISVIMPVYNSEQYLRGAIDSVLTQSFEEFELLLVDDGSSDNSGKICDEYARENKKVKVYHNENQGICATRNFAMEKAKGKYLVFIDNDDNLIQGMLEENYKLAEKNKADIVKFSCVIDESYKNGFVEKRGNYFSKTFTFTDEESPKYFEILLKEKYFSYIWNGMYRKGFLEENNLKFNTDIKCGYEDRILNYEIFFRAKKTVINKNPGYYYFQRYEHSTFKKFNENQLYSCLLSGEREYEIYKRYSSNKEFKCKWEDRAIEYLLELLFTFDKAQCNLSLQEKKDYLNKWRNNIIFKDWGDINKFPVKKRKVIKLFLGQKDRRLLILCWGYYKVIFLKKVLKNKKR